MAVSYHRAGETKHTRERPGPVEIDLTVKEAIDLTVEEAIDQAGGSVDENALFARLFRENAPRVAGLVRRFTGDEDLIDDIVQETFLRGYGAQLHLEYLDGGEERSQWPWLAAVARNLALDTFRKRSSAYQDEFDDQVIGAGPSLDDPEVHYQAARQREGIAEALDAVCPRQRRILLLREAHGWEHDRIAEHEGVSLQAMKSALARARRTFRDTYSMIAARSGLSVLTGGLVTRAQSRLRSIRDRIARMPDAMAHGMASAPAATNTLMTFAVVGAAGAVGLLAGPSSPPSPSVEFAGVAHPTDAPDLGASSSMPEIAGDPLAAAAADAEVRAEPAPTAEATVTAPAPAPAAETPAPSGTDASARVDSDEVVPVDDPPAGAGATSDVSHGDEGTKTSTDVSLDSDGDGDSWGVGLPANINCPPPERRKTVSGVGCTIHEATSDTFEDVGLT